MSGIVTGPSLTRCTCMSAPNSPQATFGREARAALAGRSGCVEAGPVAARHIGRQSELADQQQAPADIDKTAIHLVVCVGEDAQLQKFGNHLRSDCPCVASLCADEHEQSDADFTDHGTGDAHLGLGDPLNQSNHVAAYDARWPLACELRGIRPLSTCRPSGLIRRPRTWPPARSCHRHIEPGRPGLWCWIWRRSDQ